MHPFYLGLILQAIAFVDERRFWLLFATSFVLFLGTVFVDELICKNNKWKLTCTMRDFIGGQAMATAFLGVGYWALTSLQT